MSTLKAESTARGGYQVEQDPAEKLPVLRGDGL